MWMILLAEDMKLSEKKNALSFLKDQEYFASLIFVNIQYNVKMNTIISLI